QEYDYIIIDLDASLHERNTAAMEISDEVFWVLSSSETSMARTKYILDNDLIGQDIDKSKMHYILNQSTENLHSNYHSYNFSIEVNIPFYPSWMEIDEQQKVLKDTEVGEQLARLFITNSELFRQVDAVEN